VPLALLLLLLLLLVLLLWQWFALRAIVQVCCCWRAVA